MTILNLINTVAIIVCATACGQAPGTAQSLEASNAAPILSPVSQPTNAPSSVPSAIPSPMASTVSLTYYSVTQTVAPLTGHSTTTTMTGNCAEYDSNTYCWDDGEHTVTIQSGGQFDSYDFTFFGIAKPNPSSVWQACGGNCDIDVMTSPSMIDSNLTTAMAVAAPTHYQVASVNSILSTGTPTTVSCTDSAGVLTCGSIVIDTTQAGL
jgi:hypothetical protein